jgi:hypothetical protein
VKALVVARETLEALAALPLFATTPLLRPWHTRWGATAQEARSAMPGDEYFPRAQFQATRAITIDAPPCEVWPWIVQVGYGRAGFYSYDLLDSLGRPSAERIVSELQAVKMGDWVPMSPKVSDATAFKVDSFEAPVRLVWRKPDSTWSWRLDPAGSGTRLVTRVRVVYDWRKPGMALFSVFLIEFGDFAMMRRMLKGSGGGPRRLSDSRLTAIQARSCVPARRAGRRSTGGCHPAGNRAPGRSSPGW